MQLRSNVRSQRPLLMDRLHELTGKAESTSEFAGRWAELRSPSASFAQPSDTNQINLDSTQIPG